MANFNITGNVGIQGHLKIWDPSNNQILINKRNSIHYENFSEALAKSISDRTTGFIAEMHFGNGAASVDTSGAITYLPPNTTGSNADLYNPTYYKIVDDNNSLNTNPARNKFEVRHISGQTYTDILVTCLLDYGEPSDQEAFDNSTSFSDDYTFNELGLKSWAGTPNTGKLLTHVIFSPVQKALNRLIQVDYTIRISALTNFIDNS